MAQTPGRTIEDDIGQFLGHRVGEQRGVDIGHFRQLLGDRGVDPRIAVPEAGNGGPAGAVDDFLAVGRVEIDPFAAHGHDGIGEQGTVEETAHLEGSLRQ